MEQNILSSQLKFLIDNDIVSFLLFSTNIIRMSGPTIAAIVILSLIALAVFGLLFYCYFRRKFQRELTQRIEREKSQWIERGKTMKTQEQYVAVPTMEKENQ